MRPTSKVLAILSFFSLISCALGIKKEEVAVTPPLIHQYEELKNHVGENVVLEGVMLMEKFTDKKGSVHDFYEFWLEMNGNQRVFLRNAGEAISKEPFTRKVHIEGKLFHGNIDSDNEIAQSRVGYRLDFYKITIVK